MTNAGAPDRPTPRTAAKAVLIAGRCPRAWALFLTITAATVAVDLTIKTLSFRYVADQPLRLTSSPEGPVVRYDVQTPDGPVSTTWRAFLTAHQPIDPELVPLHATPQHDPVLLVHKVLELKLVVNAGAVFGLGQGGRWVFIAASVLATGVILFLFARTPAKAWIAHAPLALILAGALGNLYDRIRFGGVRDMFHLFPDVHLPFGWEWSPGVTEVYPWIWNLADASLLIGVGVILILSWKNPREAKPKTKPATKAEDPPAKPSETGD
ncbi:MAG: signal peptidase II [Planctomycetota bacterium]